MRIHTCVVIDIKTGTVDRDDFYEHNGEVALCKKGGGGGGVDKEFNSRMASVAEKEFDLSQAMYNYWDAQIRPYEEMQMRANEAALPFERDAHIANLDLSIASAGYQKDLLPLQAAHQRAALEDKIDTLGMMQPLKTNFFQQASQGKSVGGAMAQAQADAAKGFEDAAAATSRAMGRMGVNPASGRYAGVNAEQDLAKAAAVAGARTQARTETQDENFRRLAMGMQFGMGGN